VWKEAAGNTEMKGHYEMKLQLLMRMDNYKQLFFLKLPLSTVYNFHEQNPVYVVFGSNFSVRLYSLFAYPVRYKNKLKTSSKENKF
jgi:hypothetical protein